MGVIDRRLVELGIVLPPAPKAAANYAPWQKAGDLVFVSGQLTFEHGVIRYPGRVGKELSVEDGKAAARLCCLNLLSQMSEACEGDLDRITQVVRVGCFLAVAEDFIEHPPVLSGASDLIFNIFGPRIGRHTRFAASAHVLPLNSPIMIEGVFYLGRWRIWPDAGVPCCGAESTVAIFANDRLAMFSEMMFTEQANETLL